MTSTIYTVIGLLDEYAPRKIARDKAEIEWFYPGEEAIADLFESHLRSLVSEYNLQTEIKRELANSRHIYFLSEEINDLICAFYIEKGLTDSDSKGVPKYIDEQGYCHYAHGMINKSAFPPRTSARPLTGAAQETRLAFLTGAYARYGNANRFRLANAGHKARVIEELLIDLDCPWLQLTKNFRGVPYVNEVEFEMTEEMKHYFVSYKDRT